MDATVQIPANNAIVKKLGHWTSERRFEVRAHRGVAVLDLRSPAIPAGDIEINVDLFRSTLKVLVADDAVVDDWDLHRVSRAKVSDWEPPQGPAGRRIVLTGQLRSSDIRVRRGGIAMLAAMFSKEGLADLRRAHKQGGFPTVADPARTV